MIGTLAAFAWSMASRVCGMTPSSAATTIDDDVGDLGAAGTHAGEGFVAWGVEEDDLAAKGGRIRLCDLHLVGADVLRDAAGFAAGDVGLADGVEQRSLAVIDVAHDGDDGRAGDFELVGVVRREDASPWPRWPSDLRS